MPALQGPQGLREEKKQKDMGSSWRFPPLSATIFDRHEPSLPLLVHLGAGRDSVYGQDNAPLWLCDLH